MSGDEGPFRQPGRAPLQLCIVCFGQATEDPGDCGSCGAPLLPLDRPEVLAELRERARAIWQRRVTKTLLLLWGSLYLGVLAIVAAFALLANPYPSGTVFVFSGFLLAPSLLAGQLALRLAARRAKRRETPSRLPRHIWQPFIPERFSAAELLALIGLRALDETPQRALPSTSLHACLACFGCAASAAGPCARCGAAMRPLSDPDALEALRSRVKTTWWQADWKEYSARYIGRRRDPPPLARGFLADDLDAEGLLAELGLGDGPKGG